MRACACLGFSVPRRPSSSSPPSAPPLGCGGRLEPGARHRTPVVLFPAFHFTKLLVTVRDQVAAPGCPRSGTFQDWFLNDHPSTRFSQVCEDKLLTLRYDRRGHEPMSHRFSNPRGVSVRILDYGKTESAPFYEPMYEALEADGYTREQEHPRRRIRRAAHAGHGRLRAPHQAPDREHVSPERPHAGAPRRPLQRPALRAVPADAHVAGLEAPLHPRLHADRRQPPGPGRSSTRCSSPGSTSRTSRSRATTANARAAPACT